MPVGSRLALGVLLVALATTPLAAGASGGIHTVVPGESMARIAAATYGDDRAWTAILLATNARLASTSDLKFIGDPNTLVPGQKVWVPAPREKDLWMERYRAFITAVLDMSLPEPWEVSRDLVAIDPDAPVRLVTWAREGQFALGRSVTNNEIWVTVAPHLRAFCRALSTDTDLVARLEQRLGLPPASNKSDFVELTVDDLENHLFRPCADPRIDSTSCPLGPPGQDIDASHRDWFLAQYFSSYAQAHPTRYPWTSLGYTYDWGDSSSEVGESEFVIRTGATIEVTAITPTEAYCRSD